MNNLNDFNELNNFELTEVNGGANGVGFMQIITAYRIIRDLLSGD
jgi:bacteriocin-like protein